MATTYTKIATQTLDSTASSVTFSSISSSYTDLILIVTATGSTSADLILSFNNDTTVANYSTTSLNGSGSSAASNRTTVLAGISLTSNSYLRSTEQMQWNISIQNYSNATTYKTILSRTGNVPLGRVDAAVGSWRGTPAAITSLTLTTAPGTLATGSTFSLYGITAPSSSPAAKATGGTITTTSGYTIHTFTDNGTFTPSENLQVEYLVVAGGGGGYYNGGSAGGAGGFRTNLDGALLSCSSGTAYTVTIGAGGTTNTDGNVSSFNGVNASGGGGASGGGSNGGSGGSGAGGRYGSPAGTGGAGNIGGYLPVEGYAGGDGVSSNYTGGGGGGAGGVGQVAGASWGGDGGPGRESLISGTSTYYAGGGGGGNRGAGGIGGGGTGVFSYGTGGAGGVNTGGGGGGTREGAGGTGGSGIIIVRYRN